MRKNILLSVVCLSLIALSSCNDDDKLPNITPEDRGTVMDDQGNVYEWVRIGDQMWTTSNAKNGTSLAEAEYYNGFDYSYVLSEDGAQDFEENYLPNYGNPMSLEDAIASAPEGWRLPSDEDWQKLERTLGMKNPEMKGLRGDGVAFSMMNKDSGCELGLGLGGGCFIQQVWGWIEINLDYIGERGYYWTSTIDDSYDQEYQLAYFRRFTANHGDVSRACMRTDSYLSVRWVKDVK